MNSKVQKESTCHKEIKVESFEVTIRARLSEDSGYEPFVRGFRDATDRIEPNTKLSRRNAAKRHFLYLISLI